MCLSRPTEFAAWDGDGDVQFVTGDPEFDKVDAASAAGDGEAAMKLLEQWEADAVIVKPPEQAPEGFRESFVPTDGA